MWHLLVAEVSNYTNDYYNQPAMTWTVTSKFPVRAWNTIGYVPVFGYGVLKLLVAAVVLKSFFEPFFAALRTWAA
jgi:hypothetical protein